MIYIYHILTILFIYHEIRCLISPDGVIKKYTKLLNYKKGDELELSEALSVIRGIMILAWVLLGLFTFNWLYYTIFLIIQVLVMGPLFSKSLKINGNRIENKKYRNLFKINSIIGFLFGIFVIINQFHLHLSLI